MATTRLKTEIADNTNFEELLGILEQANRYALSRSGEPMWTAMAYVHEELSAHLSAGECFIVRDGSRIVATITMSLEDTLWPKDGRALYVHKLMKSSECHVKNIGLLLMQFAAREAVRLGKQCIRCDTVSTQQRLIDYYYRLGFSSKGHFVYDSSGRPGLRLEAEAVDLLKRIDQLLMQR